jgi:integrase
VSLGAGVVARVTEENGTEIARSYAARVSYRGEEFWFAAPSETKARDKAAAMRHERDRCKAMGVPWEPVDRRPQERQGPPPKLATFADDFVKEFKGKESSRRFYRERAQQFNKSLGRKRIDKITPEDVQRFHNKRLKQVSPATANHDLNALRIVLGRAVKLGIIAENPARAVKFAPEDEREDRYLYDDEAARLFMVAPPWLQPVLVIATETGMRQEELLSLRWNQVDLRAGMIRLRGSGTKNRRGRSIPITPRAHQVLSVLRRDDLADPVFTKGGRRITKNMLYKAWPETLRRARIKDFRFHDLRHTYASWAIMSGLSLDDVQRILGHRSYQLVQRYAHHAPEHLQSAARKFAGGPRPQRKDESGVANVVAFEGEAAKVGVDGGN